MTAHVPSGARVGRQETEPCGQSPLAEVQHVLEGGVFGPFEAMRDEAHQRRLLTNTLGIPPAYLDAFCRIAGMYYDSSPNWTEDERAVNARTGTRLALLSTWLHMELASGHIPGTMSMSDAAGWHLIIGRARAVDADDDRSFPQVTAAWDAIPHGWMFAAAGLTPDEAQVLLADENVDFGALRTMAGLRGIPLPKPLPGEE